MTTTALEQGAAFWQDISIKTKFQPYSIMFQVEDSCPVYMDDYRDWQDYFYAAYPAQTLSAFVADGVSLNTIHAMVKWKMITEDAFGWVKFLSDWNEHNGVTTA